jgi:hypothetical protein
VYRESLPDTFVQVQLSQRRFDTWKQSHTYMLEQIRNPDFLIQWNADKAARPQMKPKHQHGNGGGAGVLQPHGGGGGGGAASPQVPQAPIIPATSATPGNVLTYKNKFGKLNVNPNMILDLDLNPQRIVCSRCGSIHRWLVALCTSFKNKAGEIIEPKLTAEKNKELSILKWKAGFFSEKDPNTRPAERQSPSTQGTAQHASEASQRLAPAATN